jgi:hypothetical protein
VLAKLFPRSQPAAAGQGPRLRLATEQPAKTVSDSAANSH